MRTLQTYLSFILAAAVLPAIAPARAGDAPATMLLIDGSGSMWGRLDPDKRAKIDIVREALRPAIAAATQTRIGLASFGHRRRGDCSDVEIISIPALDREPVTSVVEKLNPKGKGPIAEALRQTAKALGTTRPASILVVTDGADNCQQDACEAAADVARTAPGVPVHLVSIAVEADEIPRLSCVPKATGGRYFDVRDAQSIAPALEEAARVAMLAPGASPSAPPEAALQAATPSPPGAAGVSGPALRLTASLAQGSAILSTPVHWRVSKPGGELVREGDAPDLTMNIDPGSYEVDATLGFAHARQTVSVEQGRLTAITMPLNASRLKVRARPAKDGDAATATLISIAGDKGEKGLSETVWIGHDGQNEVILPPGNYRVTASDGLARQQKQVALSAGADSDVELGLTAGRLELTASAKEDGPPIDPITFTVAEDDPDSPDGRRELARSSAALAEFTLPPGTYYISAKTGESETRQRIAVRHGDVIKRTLVVSATRLKITSLIGGQPAADGAGIIYRIMSLEGEPREVFRSAVHQLDLTLNAGRYRVEARLGALNVKASQDITLEAGKPFETILKLDAGEIGLKPPQGTSPVPGDVFWEIRDQTGRPVWHTTVVEPNALLAPGRYTVRLETRDKRTEAAFELKNGERSAVQLGPN